MNLLKGHKSKSIPPTIDDNCSYAFLGLAVVVFSMENKVRQCERSSTLLLTGSTYVVILQKYIQLQNCSLQLSEEIVSYFHPE